MTDIDHDLSKSEREVTSKDLPLYCPNSPELWNKHPKVFLPMEETGESTCPYCGCKYKLVTEPN